MSDSLAKLQAALAILAARLDNTSDAIESWEAVRVADAMRMCEIREAQEARAIAYHAQFSEHCSRVEAIQQKQVDALASILAEFRKAAS